MFEQENKAYNRLYAEPLNQSEWTLVRYFPTKTRTYSSISPGNVLVAALEADIPIPSCVKREIMHCKPFQRATSKTEKVLYLCSLSIYKLIYMHYSWFFLFFRNQSFLNEDVPLSQSQKATKVPLLWPKPLQDTHMVLHFYCTRPQRKLLFYSYFKPHNALQETVMYLTHCQGSETIWRIL